MSAAAASVLAALDALLGDELVAIQRLDGARLAAIAIEKERLAGALADVVPDPRGGRDLRALAARVQARAHANRLLLDDVTAALGRRLGVTSTGAYDRRARRYTRTETVRSGRTL